MTASYPLQLPSDPEGYYANIISILSYYLEVDAHAGIIGVTNHCQFLPSRFEVRQACEVAASNRMRLERLRSTPAPQPIGWLARPPDAPPGPDGKHPPRTIISNYDEAVRLYGKPLSRDELGKLQAGAPSPVDGKR